MSNIILIEKLLCDTIRSYECTSAYMSDHVVVLTREERNGTQHSCTDNWLHETCVVNDYLRHSLLLLSLSWATTCKSRAITSRHNTNNRDHVARTPLPDERPTDSSDFVTRANIVMFHSARVIEDHKDVHQVSLSSSSSWWRVVHVFQDNVTSLSLATSSSMTVMIFDRTPPWDHQRWY